MSKKVGLYIHIPFCKTPCGYCDFFKAKELLVPEEFVKFLLKEASLYKEEEKIVVDTIYFGGGTPSLLLKGQLKRIFDCLNECFLFDEKAEITLEANPETITENKIEELMETPINRISLGIQSLKEKTLKTLSRNVQNKEIFSAIELLSKSHIKNLSFDLILGAPNSSKDEILEDLSILTSYPFVHASLYILEIHRGTKLYDDVLKGLKVMDDETLTEIYEESSEYLENKGFVHYEISNFGRKGFECKHNLKYWKGEEYIGLGPSSHSYFRNYRMKNFSSIKKWENSLQNGEYPYEKISKESEKRRIENKIIFSLRLKEGIKKDFLLDYLKNFRNDFEKVVEKLKNGELIEDNGERISLTKRGFLLSNEVITYLLSDNFLNDESLEDL